MLLEGCRKFDPRLRGSAMLWIYGDDDRCQCLSFATVCASPPIPIATKLELRSCDPFHWIRRQGGEVTSAHF
jgi:hypothetical protein